MNLKDFVNETFREIIDGVTAAQDYAKGRGAYVIGSENMNAEITQVAFDVAVTATEGEESKQGGGLRVWGITAGREGQSSAANTTVSRIQFTLPLILANQQKRSD